MAYTVRRHRLSSITRAPLPQGDRRAWPALAGGAVSGECNRIVLDAGDVFDDAFAVRCPSIDAEVEVSWSSPSSFAPIFLRFALHRRCRQVLHLEPIRRAPPTGRASPCASTRCLRVPSCRRGRRRSGRRPDMLVETQAKASFGQHTSKRGLAHFPIQLDQVESVEDGVTDKLARMAWAMMATGECYKEPVARAA